MAMASNALNPEAQEKASRTFQALLDGIPNSIEAHDLGTFADAYAGLLEIFHQYGLESTRKAFAALATSNVGLAALVAGDPGAPSVNRFTVHWAAEALQPQPKRDWVIKDILAAGDVGILVGEGGTKKTLLTLDSGICVTHGLPWLNHETTKGVVLVIDEESGIDRLNRRLGQLMRAHRVGEETQLAYVSLEMVDLSRQAGADELETLIHEIGARFVIIDALVDVMLGGDENNTQDVQPVFHRLRTIAARQRCAIMLIHHANKVGGYRGSSAIKGAVDLMLKVESEPDSPEIKIKSEKCRDDLPPKFTAHIAFETDQVVISAADSEATEVAGAPKFGMPASYVLRFLRDHGPSSLADIEARADTCAPRSARDAVYKLTDQGYTRRTDSGSKGSAATYGLTAKGADAAKGLQ